MFKAVIDHSDLSSVLEVLQRSDISEAKFQVSEDGIIIGAIDAANVQMTRIEMPAKAFSFLLADKGDLGVNVDKLADMVQPAQRKTSYLSSSSRRPAS